MGQGRDMSGVQRIQQPHGGALLAGGQPGNRGGLGKPPSALRERLRGSLDERVVVLEQIADDESATHRDRIRAVDILAKYGLGQLREVSVEDVRGRLSATIELLRQELDPSEADRLIMHLRDIWVR